MKQNGFPILMFALSMLFMQSVYAHSGSEGGNGGNASVAEFYSDARAFSEAVISSDLSNHGATKADLAKLVVQMTVKAEPSPLLLGDMKVDAINYPDLKVIKFDDMTWPSRSVRARYQIVVHELLGLLRISDPEYTVSTALTTSTFSSAFLNSDLGCGASPVVESWHSADGKTLTLSTQVNRDAAWDDFNGFYTRHECSSNKTIVNGIDIGAEAQLGSTFMYNPTDAFTVRYNGGQDKTQASVYWEITLSEIDQTRTGIYEIKLIVDSPSGKAHAYFVTTRPGQEPTYSPSIEMVVDDDN